jgi:hypothetical protein
MSRPGGGALASAKRMVEGGTLRQWLRTLLVEATDKVELGLR